MLVGELTPIFHLLDLEVTSGAAASSASLRGNGNLVAHWVQVIHITETHYGLQLKVKKWGEFLSHMEVVKDEEKGERTRGGDVLIESAEE